MSLEIPEDSFFDDFDRTFLSLSSTLAEPYCWAYGVLRYRSISPLDPNQFDNSTSRIREIGTRILIFSTATLCFVFAGMYLLGATVVVAACSQLFRAIGVSLQKNGFTHVRGKLPEKTLEEGQLSAMTWNIRGYFGGMHYKEAGVGPWSSRLEGIIEQINSQDPDVLVLQEVYDDSLVEALIAKLQDRYAHFYVHLGIKGTAVSSGCMVLTKCAVSGFSHTDFDHNHWNHNRGFETLEIKASPQAEGPAVRIIGAELLEGKAAAEQRKEDLIKIINSIAQKATSLPTFFVGNLNAGRDDPSEGGLLKNYLYHSYWGREATHTDAFAARWGGKSPGNDASVDFISLFKSQKLLDGKRLPVIDREVRVINCHLVKGFTKMDGKPLSDHHGIFTQLQFKSESTK